MNNLKEELNGDTKCKNVTVKIKDLFDKMDGKTQVKMVG